MSASSVATSKPSNMNPTEAKDVKTEPEKKSQSTKPSVVHEKKLQEEKPKEHKEPRSLPKPASDTGDKHVHSEKSKESKTKSKNTGDSAQSLVAGVTMTSDKPKDKSDIDAALDDLVDTLGKPEESKEDDTKYTGPEVSDPMGSTHIEELGKREVTIPPKYRQLLNKKDGATQPSAESVNTMSEEVIDTLSASLGTRKPEPELDLSSLKEVSEAKAREEKLKKCGEDDETIPPEFRLKPDKDGKLPLPEPGEKPKLLSESELFDELSEDFDQSKSKEKPSKPTEKVKGSEAPAPSPVGDTVSQASLCNIQSAPPTSAPPTSATSKGVIPDDAVDRLAGSLGKREADPEDGKPIVDKVKEKAKEEDREKLGEKEETIPPNYRLEETKDKNGKPLLPKEPKQELAPMSDDLLLDALSKDFAGPQNTSNLGSKTPAPSPGGETVSKTSMCSIQSAPPKSVPPKSAPPTSEPPKLAPPKPATSKGMVTDDAVDLLAGSLGKREADPEDGKPVVDKVKEKAKAEDQEKLGEKEETIPPNYRVEETKDKDGKPLLPKESKQELQPMSDDLLLDALCEDFSGPPNTSNLEKKFDDAKLAAVISDVVLETAASTTQSVHPPPKAPQSDNKALDDALDQLSDSLGQRQPDPDESKPMEDKVEERPKAEHQDKLGEREDTIPPEYRHLLDNDEQGKSGKPSAKKPKESTKPASGQDPTDALSEDFNNCASTTETPQKATKSKGKKTDSSGKTHKNGGKSKESSKAKEGASKSKGVEKNSS